MNFQIGVFLDSFRCDVREALKKAKEVGASGIQVGQTEGSMAPRNLSAVKRKEFLDLVTSHGLIISALCGDIGGYCFREENKERIESFKRIMDLAKDLNTNIVTTHIGVIPENSSHPRWGIMQEALGELAEYGESIGVSFAVETGPETAAVLKQFLDSLNSKGAKVNFDPANLVMVTGDDPVKAVHTLKDYIVHTHAKDGIMLLKKNPEIIYGLTEEEKPSGKAFEEVPLGEGSVDFPKYLEALQSIGYTGFLTIEREVGVNPEKDVRKAVGFLNGIIKQHTERRDNI